MADHISVVPAPRPLNPAPADPSTDLVHADDWWPAISISEFRTRHRVTEEVAPDFIRAAIRSAMQSALNDLGAWADDMRLLLWARLTDVPDTMIDGQPHRVLLWQRAVMALAKVEIIETLRDYDATGHGDAALGSLDQSIIELRRDAQFAIRDLLGRARHRVALI